MACSRSFETRGYPIDLGRLRAWFKSSDLSLRSRRQHKDWGVSPRGSLVKHSKPMKWATVLKAAARSTGLMAFQTLPGVSPSASPQALLRRPLRGLKKRASKTRS
jgi:hypothetical protein